MFVPQDFSVPFDTSGAGDKDVSSKKGTALNRSSRNLGAFLTTITADVLLIVLPILLCFTVSRSLECDAVFLLLFISVQGLIISPNSSVQLAVKKEIFLRLMLCFSLFVSFKLTTTSFMRFILRHISSKLLYV